MLFKGIEFGDVSISEIPALSFPSSGIAGHGKHTLLLIHVPEKIRYYMFNLHGLAIACPSDDLTLYPRVWAVERMHALDVLMTR
jgi:hypothetical protein